jgi:hypothetical protein
MLSPQDYIFGGYFSGNSYVLSNTFTGGAPLSYSPAYSSYYVNWAIDIAEPDNNGDFQVTVSGAWMTSVFLVGGSTPVTFLSDSIGPSSWAQSQTPKTTKTCSGSSRVLQGNPNTIGKPGGFSGPSAGNIPVTANGAAVIPSQWGGRGALRPNLSQISGTFPGPGVSFQGVVDTIGSTTVPNVQGTLMNRYPGDLILELPGASQDYGVTNVQLTIPAGMNCPAGTTGSP